MLSIHWRCSYLQEVEYEVWGDGTPYKISLRWEADPYFRSIYNGDDEQWRREIVAGVAVLHTSRNEMVKPEVLAAFRALRNEYRNHAAVVTGYFDHSPHLKTWVRMPEGYAYNGTAAETSFRLHYHCYMKPGAGWVCEQRQVEAR